MKSIKRLFLILSALLLLVCLMGGCKEEEANTDISDSESETAAEPYQFKSSELENYVIVYTGDNPDYPKLALKLKNQISAKYGKKISTTRDTALEPTKYEILLGDTNRYDYQSRVMEYSVTVDEGKFRINVGGSLSAEEAINHLCDSVFNGQELVLDNGEYYKKSLLNHSCELSDGTSARIMSANLLADKFSDGSFKGAYYRAEIFAGMLVSYTPDVVGLQEADENWNGILNKYLIRIQKAHGITYSRHLDTLDGKLNYTSLLYRSDKLKVEDSDTKIFSWWANGGFNHPYHMRNVGWTQFSFLENADKKFIVANTHWSYRTEHADGKTYIGGSETPVSVNQLRVECKDETDEFLSALRQTRPDIPIFLTGDFNTSLPFFTQSGWTPTDFKIISEEAKANSSALSTVPTADHFDHIFGAGDYSVKLFDFIKDKNKHTLLSDHPLVYADLIF